MTTGSVFNRSGGPLVIDDEGRQLAAGERMDDVDLDAEPIAGHIAADRLIDVTPDPEEGPDTVAAPSTPAPTPPKNRGKTQRQES